MGVRNLELALELELELEPERGGREDFGLYAVWLYTWLSTNR